MKWFITKLLWALRCLAFVLAFSRTVAAEDPAAAIYEQIKDWPTHRSTKDFEPETLDEKLARKGTISLAIGHTYVPGPISERSLHIAMMVVWHGESGFAQDVHAGWRGRSGSDGGRAACFGQLHQNKVITHEVWESTKGVSLEATMNCAHWTAWMLQAAARKCQYNSSVESWARVLRQYGSGTGDCDPSKANERSQKEIARRVKLIGELKEKMR